MGGQTGTAGRRYESASFGTAEQTKGRYRSRGEVAIARLLDRYAIGYLYEHPLAVIDDGKTRVWYPDFQLRGYGLVIEYCGRPDDPHYLAGMHHKEEVYRENGLSALMLGPERLRGDWSEQVLQQIDRVLVDRLIRFREHRHGAGWHMWPPSGHRQG